MIKFKAGRTLILAACLVAAFYPAAPANATEPGAASRNTWRGLTPLRSSVVDVARALGTPADDATPQTNGPFPVEDGEVSFSYVTPSLARIYRAPASMVGKVFTIYFKPSRRQSRTELELTRDFKHCSEQRDRTFFYLVSDAGVAYQFDRASQVLETIIYQPTKLEIRRLAVDTDCVF